MAVCLSYKKVKKREQHHSVRKRGAVEFRRHQGREINGSCCLIPLVFQKRERRKVQEETEREEREIKGSAEEDRRSVWGNKWQCVHRTSAS